jgi:hypothetical protein
VDKDLLEPFASLRNHTTAARRLRWLNESPPILQNPKQQVNQDGSPSLLFPPIFCYYAKIYHPHLNPLPSRERRIPVLQYSYSRTIKKKIFIKEGICFTDNR